MASSETDARRERVRSLWLKSDRQIAEILIEEGYAGATPRTADGKAKQLASLRRLVWDDRLALKKKWREMKRMTSEDASETRGEHLAVLDALQDAAMEMVNDDKLKGTPRVQAVMALSRIAELKAKANGVADAVPPPSDDDAPGSSVPFLGIVVSLDKVSGDAKKKIDDWIGSGKRKDAKPK